MTYKVFLVEDEIVTREGIRDTVDWAAAGYYFCGEAPDGEIALPLMAVCHRSRAGRHCIGGHGRHAAHGRCWQYDRHAVWRPDRGYDYFYPPI
jgi:hypothetical protein